MKNLRKTIIGTVVAVSLCLTKAAAGGNVENVRINAESAGICREDGNEIARKTSGENAEIQAKYAKAAYLTETTSGATIYEKEATKRLPIASMCKIMTLILCFDAIDEGNLSLEEKVTVSEKAAGMGGSQIFLEANGEYGVRELLKSIAVCSANDSCVAMAERLAGSEAAFVAAMNERAKSLGMENTLFSNCTGLPKEPQYSCAKDAATMLCELVKHEEYFEFCKVRTEKFEHPKGRITEMTNTNRLVRFYQGCDGGKTGFTNEAGFCLAATAKRGGMRIVSVVVGEDSSKHRFDEVREMFDYAFSAYALKVVADDINPLPQRAAVRGGKAESVAVRCERGSCIFSKRNEKDDVQTETLLPQYLSAPVKAGDKIGEFVVYKNGAEIDRVPLIAAESTEKANFFDRLKDVAEGWNC